MSPLLSVTVTVPTCAPGSRGAHRSSLSAMSVCGAAVPLRTTMASVPESTGCTLSVSANRTRTGGMTVLDAME